MDRCEDDNNLRGTPRGSRRETKAGRQPTSRILKVVLCCGLEKNGMVRAYNERDMDLAWQV